MPHFLNASKTSACFELKPNRSAYRPTTPISLDCAGEGFGLRQAWLKRPIKKAIVMPGAPPQLQSVASFFSNFPLIFFALLERCNMALKRFGSYFADRPYHAL